MKLIEDKTTFEQLIAKEKPVIVKFFTTWCPDCRRMDMFIDDIIKEHDEYDWYELNKDELPDISDQYDVMGIPSLLIFKNGKKIAHLHSANAKSPEQVQDFLQNNK
ncbi:thioredoxin-like negative regulator of GroEL [Oikeobacillus pervagus]|uniref:Thioredoxin-like negative regulator of GroEL n=1 Tax=Oikeobacillus pervagus TaxID=1325931 RepID=A0AAJ1T1U4_9BACI|nr:thioredoxin family protein [Oikeobacillus pervagus]MDQ0215126.1 thioredoxin-like negative regulator of GroEL [Oikeobacillus pervagus]